MTAPSEGEGGGRSRRQDNTGPGSRPGPARWGMPEASCGLAEVRVLQAAPGDMRLGAGAERAAAGDSRVRGRDLEHRTRRQRQRTIIPLPDVPAIGRVRLTDVEE